MDAAVLVPLDAAPVIADGAPAVSQAPCEEAQALASALAQAQDWTPEILTLALASLGDIDLPAPAAPPRQAGRLAVLPTLYWVYGLDQAGLLQAARVRSRAGKSAWMCERSMRGSVSALVPGNGGRARPRIAQGCLRSY